jgi:F-type H+-transporting ATPase subunit b
MRIRPLIAALAVVLLTTFGWAGAAHAQEEPAAGGEEHELDHAAEECIHLLEEGKDIDACQEAPSPILPDTNELIWGIISFVALFFLLWKFALPGIKKGMEGRTERIRSDLDAAEGAKAEGEKILEDYKAQLADARNESGRIIEEARQTADALKRDAEARLQTELTEIRQRATADIEASKAQAIADLRDEVAKIAIGAAEVVIQRNLDRDTQIQLIEEYISSVGAVRS